MVTPSINPSYGGVYYLSKTILNNISHAIFLSIARVSNFIIGLKRITSRPWYISYYFEILCLSFFNYHMKIKYHIHTLVSREGFNCLLWVTEYDCYISESIIVDWKQISHLYPSSLEFDTYRSESHYYSSTKTFSLI